MATGGFRDVREFAAYLEKRGVLRRLRQSVSPRFELAEISRRAAALPGGGPALLFENVRGASVPVLTNLTGPTTRLAWSLNLTDLHELESAAQTLLNPAAPLDLTERLTRLGETSHLARFGPRSVRTGPCQEVVRPAEAFLELPFVWAWPDETGPALRSALLFRRPAAGRVGVERADLVLSGSDIFLCGLTAPVEEAGPVALVVGAEPALLFAARAPFLPPVDPLTLAGVIGRRRLDLVRCRTSEIEVPALAEFVLEGVAEPLPPEEAEIALTLCQPSGFYGQLPALARFRPLALTHRRDPLFLSPVIGPTPHEELSLVKGAERLLLPLLKLAVPEITELGLPTEGAFYNLAIVAIRKSYPGQAQRVMYALWGHPLLAHLKHVIVVDADCELHQPSLLAARVLALLDPTQDILTVKGPLSAQDGASPTPGVGSKIGLDATRKLPGEGGSPNATRTPQAPAALRELLDQQWLEFGLE